MKVARGVVQHEPPGGCIHTECGADCLASESQQTHRWCQDSSLLQWRHMHSGLDPIASRQCMESQVASTYTHTDDSSGNGCIGSSWRISP